MYRKTLVYCRVSGGEGQSTAAQRKVLLEYVSKHYPDATWLPDDIISGRSKNRPGFITLLNEVRANWVQKIIVYKIDRIGRNAKENLELADECLKRNIDIIGAANGTRLLGPDGKFMYGLLSLLAEREVDVLSERTKHGMAIAREQHKAIGGSAGGLSQRVYDLIPTIALLKSQGYSCMRVAKVVKANYKTILPIYRNPEAKWQTRRMLLEQVPMAQRGKKYQLAMGVADPK